MKETRGYPLDYIAAIPPILQLKYYDPKNLNADKLAKIA
jgi:hypothetical protein